MSFEPGAPPAAGFVPLSVPEIRGREWQYVKECLDTGWVSSVGAFVERFERELAACVGARFAVATTSGTAALHVALLVAGVQPDDEVLVSTLTFIAPVNAIRYVGAWPVFIDAEPEYGQMDVNQVAEFLQTRCVWCDGTLRNPATGRRVSAILPVHVLGHPVDMDPLRALARRYGLVMIEDATESLGADYRGQRTGRLGDLACFSFNGNKILTTGGGGMLVTDCEAWATRARYLTTQAKDDPVEYVHKEIGFNYRLTNLQAAVGCAQLEQLDAYVAAKRRIAAAYADGLRDVPGLRPLGEAPWARSTFWLSSVAVDPHAFGQDARALLRRLADARIQARPLWQPIHRSPAHAVPNPPACPVADRLHATVLSLPSSVGLSPADQQRVITALREAGPANSR
jgi:perosamine synthetase